MKRTVAVALALVFVLMLAIPASAGAPTRENITYDLNSPLWDPSPCPGLDVRLREVGTGAVTYFYDAQGNLKYFRIMAQGTDYVFNAVTPDIVLTGHFSAEVVFDANGVPQYELGRILQVTVPGYGTVVFRAGRWNVVTGQFLGNNSLDNPKDVAQMCSLLARN